MHFGWRARVEHINVQNGDLEIQIEGAENISCDSLEQARRQEVVSKSSVLKGSSIFRSMRLAMKDVQKTSSRVISPGGQLK